MTELRKIDFEAETRLFDQMVDRMPIMVQAGANTSVHEATEQAAALDDPEFWETLFKTEVTAVMYYMILEPEDPLDQQIVALSEHLSDVIAEDHLARREEELEQLLS